MWLVLDLFPISQFLIKIVVAFELPISYASRCYFALPTLDQIEALWHFTLPHYIVSETERAWFNVACNRHQILSVNVHEQRDALQEGNFMVYVVLLIILDVIFFSIGFRLIEMHAKLFAENQKITLFNCQTSCLPALEFILRFLQWVHVTLFVRVVLDLIHTYKG